MYFRITSRSFVTNNVTLLLCTGQKGFDGGQGDRGAKGNSGEKGTIGTTGGQGDQGTSGLPGRLTMVGYIVCMYTQ